MFRPLARSHRRPHRRGTSFTLIVVVMISFAAAVGVAFAIFAGQAVRTASAYKEGEGGGGQPHPLAPNPTDTINRFLSGLIYDADNDSDEALTNALRGHSIARSMYGFDYSLYLAGTPITTPWAGVGTIQGRTQVNYTQQMYGANTTPTLLDPEYTQPRVITGSGLAANRPAFAVGSAGSYVGKHAGYSYPDLKDYFAAAIDPATGQVVTPSFHRDWLFRDSSRPPAESPLAATNSNWGNANGRFYTLRPRSGPVNGTSNPEHPKFPRVPPNADGTYTGDVQNWPGGYTFVNAPGFNAADVRGWQFHGRNDSLWMHIGLPLVQFGNRKVQPLVAPLIVPLDGLFNASAHGNNYGPTQAPVPPSMTPTPTHMSHLGLGPWEVNMGPALPNNRADVVGSRGTTDRYGSTDREFAPYVSGPIPDYSPVWWMSGTVAATTYPSGNSLRGLPGGGGYTDNSKQANHPSLFSPNDWAAGSPGTFALTDIKRMQLRYAFKPEWYDKPILATTARMDLLGNTPPTYVHSTGQQTVNAWRLDPAHPNRQLFTTRGFGLDRPKVVPTYTDRSGAAGLSLAGGALRPTNMGAGSYPAPGGIGNVSDFVGSNQWASKAAALGAVNLNRKLTDYRPTTGLNQSLSTTNAANANADTDRRQLAHDIFVRLIAATGGSVKIYTDASGGNVPGTLDYTTMPIPAAPPAANSPQYDALRYLAQLAVNIVDYIDNDDVSTVLEWNPRPGAGGAVKKPTDPLDAANFDPLEMGNRVVFGVEKPRVVINEAYSEIVNNHTDPTIDPDPNPALDPRYPLRPLAAGSQAHVRFWVELLNPGTRLTGNTPTANQPNVSPLGDGTVNLGNAYRIEIARANRQTGSADGDIRSYLGDPRNVTGKFKEGSVADITYTLPAAARIEPNDGIAQPNGPNQGILLVAPRVPPPPQPLPAPAPQPPPKADEFNPQGGPWTAADYSNPGASPGAQGMAYTLPMPATMATVLEQTTEFKRHVVLLRRLANPYSPAGPTNPFITIDTMDYVQSYDSIYRLIGQTGMPARRPRDPNAKPNPNTEYDPPGDRFSIGKVQAYAAHTEPTTAPPGFRPGLGEYNKYQFPASMVLNQTRPEGGPRTNTRKHTFGTHNYVPNGKPPGPGNPDFPSGSTLVGATLRDPDDGTTETLMTPFDWLIHMDRPLINQIELMSVRDTAPHRVTEYFVQSSGGGVPLQYENGLGKWQTASDGLVRALEFLTVKPYTTGVAHGGRVPGQINLNAVQDKRVLDGVLDPQGGNGFNNAFRDAAWTNWMATRSTLQAKYRPDGLVNPATPTTPVPGTRAGNASATPPEAAYMPAASKSDDPANGTDRPFYPLGAPATNGGYGPYAGGAGEELTILRRDQTLPQPTPYLFTTPTAGSATAYLQSEPVRKIFNNVTTVSHTYVMFLTIGYFEIDTETVNPQTLQRDGLLNLGGTLTMPRLGQEASLLVPGDLRQKVMAVIDMSNLALDTGGGQATTPPFFTTLEDNAYVQTNAMGQLDPFAPVPLRIATDASGGMADGVTVALPVDSKLVIGYGADEQIVTVRSSAAGTVTVTSDDTVRGFRPAWAGSSVSNVRPGYAGPQGSSFKYTSNAYKAVVPYVERLK